MNTSNVNIVLKAGKQSLTTARQAIQLQHSLALSAHSSILRLWPFKITDQWPHLFNLARSDWVVKSK